MPPLRAHTKSRNGCDQCRHRRVKCDEQGPPCSNCTNRELKCTYFKVAASRRAAAHTPPSDSKSNARPPPRSLGGLGLPVAALPGPGPAVIATIPDPAQSNSFGVDNLELMHKFATETYKSLCISDSEAQVWQTAIPRLALKHTYLMNGILALASMHIATTCSAPAEARMYHETGLQYYDRSLTPFRNAIDGITSQNSNAVFAHSIVMIAINIASPRLTATKDEGCSITENVVVLFELLKGVKKILQVSRSCISLRLFSQGEYWKDASADLDPDTGAALAHLAVLNDQVMTGVHSDQHRVNEDVIAHLRHCYAKFTCSPDPAPVLAWLGAVEKDFADSLRCRQPFSLLILIHWGVLLMKLDRHRWWARNAGRVLVSELLGDLRSRDPRWEGALAWVQRNMDSREREGVILANGT